MLPWGFAIPGLAMAAAELPNVPGLCRLENPEIGDGVMLESAYTLEDAAELHLRLINNFAANSDKLIIVGISLGAMIAAVLAGTFRSKLPARVRFRLLVTSSNTVDCPAVPDALLEQWKGLTLGDEAGFACVLKPFFSDTFKASSPQDVENYVRYRSSGANRQSAKAFRRQTAALRAFNGMRHFSSLEQTEITFIGGGEDSIFGPKHSAELKRLLPDAIHDELPHLGHMANIEEPSLFERNWKVMRSRD